MSTPSPLAPSPLAAIRLVGERLCLDFANTADWHAGAQPVELLTRYDDLLAWGVRVGVLEAETAARLRDGAARHPDDAERVRQGAVALREAVYRAFVAVAGGQTPDAADMERINAALVRAMVHIRVTRDGDDFAWGWADDTDGADGADNAPALDRMLWPVARSAAELLTAPRDERDRVRQCESDDGCGWLFVDTTRNRSRRWCSMESCGNRAKARRHYARHRPPSPP